VTISWVTFQAATKTKEGSKRLWGNIAVGVSRFRALVKEKIAKENDGTAAAAATATGSKNSRGGDDVDMYDRYA
jgi:hypothetical protein